jgi:hypothetical protein
MRGRKFGAYRQVTDTSRLLNSALRCFPRNQDANQMPAPHAQSLSIRFRPLRAGEVTDGSRLRIKKKIKSALRISQNFACAFNPLDRLPQHENIKKKAHGVFKIQPFKSWDFLKSAAV